MMRKVLIAAGTAATLLLPASPAPAAHAADGCFIGSPNIIRDVTDCVNAILSNCSPGSPNILEDVKACLR